MKPWSLLGSTVSLQILHKLNVLEKRLTSPQKSAKLESKL
jgi:hypothetical protein